LGLVAKFCHITATSSTFQASGIGRLEQQYAIADQQFGGVNPIGETGKLAKIASLKLIVVGSVGTVDKSSMFFRSTYPSSLWKSSRKSRRRHPILISSAAPVSTDRPLPNVSFFLVLFLSL